MHIMDGQPAVGSPNTNVRTTITTIKTKAAKQNKIPQIDDITNGAVEKATIPFKA